MALDNTLNISELLRRIGVKGDSLGSAPLLESLRLSLLIGDLSDLVPPVAGPYGGASLRRSSGIATVNKWNLACSAPGGLRVQTIDSSSNTNYVFNVWVTQVNPFGALAASTSHNFSFGQEVRSEFRSYVLSAAVAPGGTFILNRGGPMIGRVFENWVGPGEFFNIESETSNVDQEISISWKEYPAALNPG